MIVAAITATIGSQRNPVRDQGASHDQPHRHNRRDHPVTRSRQRPSAPAASARPADFTPAGKPAPTSVYSRPDKSMIPLPAPYVGDIATAPQAILRAQTLKSGFDWGDAGIGAAGGLTLSMIALGGGLAVSQRRGRSAPHSTA